MKVIIFIFSLFSINAYSQHSVYKSEDFKNCQELINSTLEQLHDEITSTDSSDDELTHKLSIQPKKLLLELLYEHKNLQATKKLQFTKEDCHNAPLVVELWLKRQRLELHQTNTLPIKKQKSPENPQNILQSCIFHERICPDGQLIPVDTNTCAANCDSHRSRQKIGFSSDYRVFDRHFGFGLSLNQLWGFELSSQQPQYSTFYFGPELLMHYAYPQPILGAQIQRFRAFLGVELSFFYGNKKTSAWGILTHNRGGWAINQGLDLDIQLIDHFYTFESECNIAWLWQNQFLFETGLLYSWIAEFIQINGQRNHAERVRPLLRFSLLF